MQYHKFVPGDKARILPSWWEKLASVESSEVNSYVRNGIDYIYTVASSSGRAIQLEEDRLRYWDAEYLIPADEYEEEAANIIIDDLL